MSWGRPYAPGKGYRTHDGQTVHMYRKRQRVRFYTDDGQQVGPELANVYPAICYAHGHGWWDLDMSADMNVHCILECRQQLSS